MGEDKMTKMAHIENADAQLMEIHIQGIDHKNTPKFMTKTRQSLS